MGQEPSVYVNLSEVTLHDITSVGNEHELSDNVLTFEPFPVLPDKYFL